MWITGMTRTCWCVWKAIHLHHGIMIVLVPYMHMHTFPIFIYIGICTFFVRIWLSPGMYSSLDGVMLCDYLICFDFTIFAFTICVWYIVTIDLVILNVWFCQKILSTPWCYFWDGHYCNNRTHMFLKLQWWSWRTNTPNFILINVFCKKGLTLYQVIKIRQMIEVQHLGWYWTSLRIRLFGMRLIGSLACEISCTLSIYISIFWCDTVVITVVVRFVQQYADGDIPSTTG